jgi:ABC-type Fe3+-hydroxamate transport system substrate-binding protein
MAPTLHPAQAWSGDGQLHRPARRIVSLLPSATEIVCALGLADRLVAVTHECDYPPDALAGIPRITSNLLPPEVRRSDEIDAAVRAAVGTGHGLYDLDEVALTQLEPDLVLTQELCSVCAVAYPQVLQAARVAGGGNGPMVVSLEPHSLTDVFAIIGLVARLAGVGERGPELVRSLQARVNAVPRPPSRRRVAIIEWLSPLFAPGHWVPEQIELAGGVSVFGEAGERSRESSGRPSPPRSRRSSSWACAASTSSARLRNGTSSIRPRRSSQCRPTALATSTRSMALPMYRDPVRDWLTGWR